MGILVAMPIAATLAILGRRKIEETVFMAIGIIILLVIGTGLVFENTIIGVDLSVVLGAGSLLYCFVIFLRDRKKIVEYVLTPGLWGCLIFSAIYAVLLIGKTDLGESNDTFWAHAPQIINMYQYSDIGNKGLRAGTFFLLYTAPVYTGWCYFCNRLWWEYSDGINLWARQIFIMSSLIPLYTNIDKKDKRNLVLVSLIIVILPLVVDQTYDLMPDIPIAGAMVYGTLMTIRLFQNREKYNDILYLLGACIWLALISSMKRAGGIYTYGIVGISTVYTIERIKDTESFTPVWKKILPLLLMFVAVCFTLPYSIYRYRYFRQDKLYTLLPFACFAGYMIMGAFCCFIKSAVKKKKYILICAVLSAISMGVIAMMDRIVLFIRQTRIEDIDSENIHEIFYLFIHTWFTRENYIGDRFGNGWIISDFSYTIIVFCVLMIVRAAIKNKGVLREKSIHDFDSVIIPVFIGYILYMIFYCFVYMVYDKGYVVDGSIGHADRYFGPAIMLTTVVAIYEVLNTVYIKQEKTLLLIIGILIILFPYNPFHILQIRNENWWEEYNVMLENAGIELSEEDFFLCIGPAHSQYYLFPARSHLNDDVKYAILDADEWEEQVYTKWYYNYLVLEDYDWTFPEKYQGLFEGGIENVQKWTIYDIQREGGEVKFIKRK